MSSLADALAREAARRGRGQCHTGAWIKGLGKKDREAVVAAMDACRRGEMKNSAIWRACREFGLTVQQGSLRRHIKGECGCEPR